ncbi:hypothetical protein AC579_10247 [Pseudocercospora musae]|uniref:CoA-transferase family III n=1 Tax=Pseudocercospora musae TaxID=113226 RepID=A0A139I1E2_9PEZI|nr:hypothetical protein AC579_10247 [Pseudocercospora musae]
MTDIYRPDGSFDCTTNRLPHRSKFDAEHTIRWIWKDLGLPGSNLPYSLLGERAALLPSSFNIGHLAQASIALSALAAASVDALRNNAPARKYGALSMTPTSFFRATDLALSQPKKLGPEHLSKLRPGLIYASLNAWGDDGPWAHNRGFGSIVQTVSGMNVSEAEHFGTSPAKAMPVQALDHAAGYLLATGISAALYKRAIERGSWEVTVSLAGVMKYLRSLGQHPGRSGFECEGLTEGELESFLEARETGFGTLRAVSHSAQVEGKHPGWDVMPKLLGSDQAEWL